jgi:hypothetical protein
MYVKLRVNRLPVTSLWALAISAVKVVMKCLRTGRLVPCVFVELFIKEFASERWILVNGQDVGASLAPRSAWSSSFPMASSSPSSSLSAVQFIDPLCPKKLRKRATRR